MRARTLKYSANNSCSFKIISLLAALGTFFMSTAILGGFLPRACTAFTHPKLPGALYRSTFRASSSTATNIIRKMSSSSSSAQNDQDLRFGPFRLASDQIFYTTQLSAAFVNLRPIVPGHVLVMPKRNNIPLLSDLTDDEYHDLWQTVRVVQQGLKQHYTNCQAFNVAVQDGEAAGQSVPHVHVHILPRVPGDYERNDDIYQDIQDWAPRADNMAMTSKKSSQLDVPDDGERKDRTTEEMAEEAATYRRILVEKHHQEK